MQEWKPERPENEFAWPVGVFVGILVGLICYGVSTPSDWPGNLIASILFGLAIGGITYAGIAK